MPPSSITQRAARDPQVGNADEDLEAVQVVGGLDAEQLLVQHPQTRHLLDPGADVGCQRQCRPEEIVAVLDHLAAPAVHGRVDQH